MVDKIYKDIMSIPEHKSFYGKRYELLNLNGYMFKSGADNDVKRMKSIDSTISYHVVPIKLKDNSELLKYLIRYYIYYRYPKVKK